MNPTGVALPAYEPATFVDRAEQVELVRGLARQISDGATPRLRTIVFQGGRGVGKTWLALHLARTILPGIPGVRSLLISFLPTLETPPPEAYPDEWAGDIQAEPARRAHAIIAWVAERLGAPTSATADLRVLSDWLARFVEQQYKERVLVLILDSVFEADESLLKLVEQHLLAPLASLSRVLIMITGRGRPYSWESPYLRVETITERLSPFDERQTAEQVHKQVPRARLTAEQLVELGGGHPLSTFLLAEQTRAGNETDALEKVAEVLLCVVPHEAQRQRVRWYFEALCPLDGFRENEIAPMLATYSNDPRIAAWPIGRSREVRDELARTHLMRWENGRFVIDESIRTVLANLLRLRQPMVWRRLQCQAFLLYHQWADEFPRWREYYNERATTHAQTLRAVGVDPDQCEAMLATQQ
jgi:hypothetical protein